MFRYGIISEEEAIEKLKEIGYSEEDATNMVKLAEITAKPRERRITRSDVIRLGRNGWINEDEAVDLLMELG